MTSELPPCGPSSHHSPLSGWLLLAVPLTGVMSYSILGYYAGLTAIALLMVPFAIFCWIFTTIRAIHMAGVQFWFIPSTYVTLTCGVISLVMCAIMLLVADESTRRAHDVSDTTLCVAAAILYSGCAVWSYWYNWRRTNSAMLALSLTILQVLTAVFLIAVFGLWLDGKSTKWYAREHDFG